MAKTAPKRALAVSDEIATETFRSILHGNLTPEGKIILLELARRGGHDVMDIKVLGDTLGLRVGDVERALPQLARAGIVLRPTLQRVELAPEHMDLVGVLGHLVESA